MGWKNISCFFVIVYGCASYTAQTEKIRSYLRQERYSDALEAYPQTKTSKSNQNAVLTGMEMGMLYYLNGQYVQAARTWRKSLDKTEELYTVSLSKEAASLVVSDDMTDYMGETHERVLLPVYSAISYLFAASPDKTLNETRRLLELFKSMEADGVQPDQNRDRLAHYMAAFAYELKGDLDAALIEYRASAEGLTVGAQAKGWASFVGQEIFKIAKARRRSDILDLWRGKAMTLAPDDWADVLVLYEVGQSPIKIPEDVFVPTGKTVVRVSFPVYKRISTVRGPVGLKSNGVATEAFMAMDIESLAEKSLSNRRGKDLAKMAARLILKDQSARVANNALGPLAGLGVNVIAAVTETADTRSWTTLPASLYLSRVKIPPGTSVFQATAGGVQKIQKVELRSREKQLLRFHLQ